jgi:hypothetical protein
MIIAIAIMIRLLWHHQPICSVTHSRSTISYIQFEKDGIPKQISDECLDSYGMRSSEVRSSKFFITLKDVSLFTPINLYHLFIMHFSLKNNSRKLLDCPDQLGWRPLSCISIQISPHPVV